MLSQAMPQPAESDRTNPYVATSGRGEAARHRVSGMAFAP